MCKSYTGLQLPNQSVHALLLLLLCTAAAELAAAPNLELLLKEATEAYRAGDYNRALALCQPVRSNWQQQQQLQQQA